MEEKGGSNLAQKRVLGDEEVSEGKETGRESRGMKRM